MGSTLSLAAGRGVAWNQVIDQSGASTTGWTNWAGNTVTSSGGVFTCSASGTQARFGYGAIPIGQIAIMECELQFSSAGSSNASIAIGIGSSSFAGVVIDMLTTSGSGTGASVRIDRYGIAGGPAWAHADWAMATWYKLRVIRVGASFQVYLDGTFIGTGDVNADSDSSYLILSSYQSNTKWRNVKAWNGVFTDVGGTNVIMNDRGVFAASTAYVNGDIVTYGSCRFMRTGTPFTSGTLFDPAYWVALGPLGIDNPASWTAANTADQEFDASSSSLPSGWSWVNQGGATYTEAYGAARLALPTSVAHNWRGIVRAVPAGSSWTAVAKISYASLYTAGAQYSYAAIVLRDSGSGKFLTHSLYGSRLWYSEKWTNETTYSAAGGYSAVPMSGMADGGVYVRIRKNGTTSYDLEASGDGKAWYTLAAAYDVSAWITPDQIGLFANTVGGAADFACDWMRVR